MRKILSEHKTTVRFSEEFNEELRIAMAKRRIGSLQAAVDQALRLWIDGPPASNPLAKSSEPADLTKSDRDKKIANALLEWFKHPTEPDEELNLVMKHTLAKMLGLSEFLAPEDRIHLRKKK